MLTADQMEQGRLLMEAFERLTEKLGAALAIAVVFSLVMVGLTVYSIRKCCEQHDKQMSRYDKQLSKMIAALSKSEKEKSKTVEGTSKSQSKVANKRIEGPDNE